MILLHVNVSNKHATYQQRDGRIVCGNTDYGIKFTFDDEWDAYTEKTARFIWNGQFIDVEFTGDTCEVPIIRNTNAVHVGVYAGDLSTTTSAIIGCTPSILCESATPSVENDKYYENEAKQARDMAESYADDARHMASDANNSKIVVKYAEANVLQARDETVEARDVAVEALENAEATIASIPEDYTDLANAVKNKIDKDSITNQVGNSKELVASQYFVTDHVSKNIAATQRLAELKDDQLLEKVKISEGMLDKRITNLESGLPASAWQTDDSVAYSKDVPSNALPYAAVTRIGGMSYKTTENQLQNAAVTGLTINGANLFDKSKVIGLNQDITETETGFCFTKDASMSTGAPTQITPHLRDIAPQLKAGDIVTAYATVINGVYAPDNVLFHLRGSLRNVSAGKFIEITEDDLNNGVYAYGINGKLCEYIDVVITKVQNSTYYPYKEPVTTPIPESVQNLDGYGLGVSNEHNNYIDWRPADGLINWVQGVYKFVFDGTENWKVVINDAGTRQFFYLEEKFPGGDVSNRADGLGVCSHLPYTTLDNNEDAESGSRLGACIYTSGILRIRKTIDIITLDEWKAWLAEQYAAGNPVTVVYTLVEPIITDISDIMLQDNLFEVEGGGSITFDNEYGYATPSTVKYQLDTNA